MLPPAFKQVDFGLQRAEDCFRLAALASDSKTLANKAKLSIAANSRTAISAARGHAQDSLSQAYYSQTSLRPQKRTKKALSQRLCYQASNSATPDAVDAFLQTAP